MSWDQIEDNWAEFKYLIKQHWSVITDDQLTVIAGKREHLIGKIQVMYGINREMAEQQLSDWQETQINVDGHFYQAQTPLQNIGKHNTH